MYKYIGLVMYKTKRLLKIKRPPLVIVGPSGSGKDTIVNELKKRCEFVESVIGWTSRPPRQGEIDGVHYHFTTKEVMEQKRNKNEFVECVELYGNIYGMTFESIQSIVDKGKLCVMILNVHGLEVMKTFFPRLVCVYIAPPSLRELEHRLKTRGCKNEQDFQCRMDSAMQEMKHFESTGVVTHKIVNYTVGDTVDKLTQLI